MHPSRRVRAALLLLPVRYPNLEGGHESVNSLGCSSYEARGCFCLPSYCRKTGLASYWSFMAFLYLDNAFSHTNRRI